MHFEIILGLNVGKKVRFRPKIIAFSGLNLLLMVNPFNLYIKIGTKNDFISCRYPERLF